MKEFFSKYKWPLLIAATAILVRIIYLIEVSQKTGFSVPMVDEQWHWLWAQEIVEKSFWGEGSYFRGPLYPYLLAILYFITGGSIFWAKLLQVFLCGGTALFIFRTAQHFFGSKAGAIAGLIYAFYGTLIFYEAMFLIPALFLFLTTWGMYRFIAFQNSRSVKTWITTGLIFGLAALATPNILLVLPFLALWVILKHKQNSANLLEATRPAVLFILGVILAILPVTIRNAAVTGEFVLISTQGGINFYLGNNDYADGLTMIMPEVDLNQSISWDMFVPATNAYAEREIGREMSDGDISDFWNRKALEFILENPEKFLNLVWRKTVYLASGFENSDAADIYYQRNKSVLYSYLVWDFLISFPLGVLLPIAIVSVFVLRNDFRKLLPLYIFILAYIPSIVLFLVTARHRLPIIPFLIIIASGGLVRFFQTDRDFSFIKKGTIAALLIVCVFVLNQKYFDLGLPNPFTIHYNEGLVHHRLGNYEKAEQEYLQAHVAFPFSAALAVNLAEVQLKLNKTDEADKNLAKAIQLEPSLALSYNNLGILVKGKGNLDSALILFKKAIEHFNPNAARENEIGDYYVNLADTYKQLNLTDSAAEAFHQAMMKAPLLPKAFYQAALFHAEQEEFDISDSIYELAEHIKPADASEQFNEGMTYFQRSMYNEGMGAMRGVLKKDDKFYQAWYVIAVMYQKSGEPKDSVNFYLNKCLAVAPDFEPAVELKKQMKK